MQQAANVGKKSANIIRFVLSTQNKLPGGGTEVIIATEFCPGGTLAEAVLKREQPLSHRQIIEAFRQVMMTQKKAFS